MTASLAYDETASWIPTSPGPRSRRKINSLLPSWEAVVRQFDVTSTKPGSIALPDDATSMGTINVTNAAAEREPTASVGPEIYQIRRLSGLTWAELGQLLNVVPRTLHHWANGKPINSANEARVRRLLGTLRRMDRGEGQKNRALILSPCPTGGLMMDLLTRAEYDVFDSLVEAGAGRQEAPGQLSPAAAVERKPLPVDVLLSANPDEAKVNRGRFVRAGRIFPRQRPDRE